MTWNSITPEKFVELVNYWVNQDWPLTEDKLTAAMEKLGWDESDPSTYWKAENGCEFQISNRRSAIAVYIHSPQYANVLNSI